jgi:hypothetical protein
VLGVVVLGVVVLGVVVPVGFAVELVHERSLGLFQTLLELRQVPDALEVRVAFELDRLSCA